MLRKRESTKTTLATAKFLWPYFRRSRGTMLSLALVLFLRTGSGLVTPFIIRAFVDRISAETLTEAGARDLILSYVAVGLLSYLLAAAESGLAESVAWNSTNRLREEVLEHALALPLNTHSRHSPGTWVERVDGDIALLSNFFSRFIITVIGQLLVIVGVLAALIAVDWQISLIFGVCLIPACFGVWRAATWGRSAYRADREAVGDYMGTVEERLYAFRDLQALGAVDHALSQMQSRHRRILTTELRASLLGSSIVWSTASIFTAVVTVIALSVTGQHYGSGTLTLGGVYLVFSFTQQIQDPLIQLSTQMQDFQRAMAGLSRTRELLQLPKEKFPELTSVPLNAQSVRLDAVDFSYTADQPAVTNLNLSLNAGETLGIVGRTGAGKSTIARLIAGLITPSSGAIYLGGVDISNVNRRDLRRHIAFVPQQVFIWDSSIRNNVAALDDDIDDATVEAVLDAVGLTQRFERFTDGIHTQISEDSISAGEAQLLGLSRVLVRDPAVLVLDEASAKIDPNTEALVRSALDKVTENRIAVIIAHRLTTLDNVDSIAVVDDGRIVEFGKREDLLNDPSSLFFSLRHREY